MDFDKMSMAEIRKLPGVVDLPGKANMAFAGALRAEALGDRAKAERMLILAVRYENENG